MKKAKEMITSLSIYDHGTYLKMKNNWSTPHFCGGLATILVFVMLLAVMTIKLIEIFDYQTMSVTMENTVSSSFIKTSIVTTQTNSSFFPFMIGIHQEGIFQITASTDNGEDETEIVLDNCSMEHFKGFPDLETVFQMVEVSRMKCLPLNKTYNLGGVQYRNEVETIKIKVLCLPFQTCTSQNSIQMVSMYGITNPFDKENPVLMYGTTRTFPFFNAGQMNPLYIMSLGKKTITTNRAIWPLQQDTQVSVVHSLSDNIILNDGGENALKFTIWSSQEEINYQRNFLTLIDGLAYIGGIFGSLVSIFFFMRAYSQSFFVNSFASEVFGNKYGKDYGFKEYLRGCAAGILGLCKTVDWQEIKEQEENDKTVSRTLSLQYLFRRIEFLQNAMEVNFESHQLKGLHLLKKSSREANDQRYKAYKLRERMIEYFKNRGGLRIVDGKEHGMTSAENMALEIFEERGTDNDDFFSEVDGSIISQEDQHEGSEEEQEARKKARYQDIQKEIYSDIRQFMEEGQKEGGDEMSKLIYQRLDSRMKECLNYMCRKQEMKKNM